MTDRVRITSDMGAEVVCARLEGTNGMDEGGGLRLIVRTLCLTQVVFSGQREAPRRAAARSRRDISVTSTMSTSSAPSLSSTRVSGKVHRSVSAPVSW